MFAITAPSVKVFQYSCLPSSAEGAAFVGHAYPSKDTEAPVPLKISIYLLLDDPSEYSEMNNSVAFTASSRSVTVTLIA